MGNPKKPQGTPATASATTFLLDDASVASGLAASQADAANAVVAEEAALNPLGLATRTGGLAITEAAVLSAPQQRLPRAAGRELVSDHDLDDLGGSTTSSCLQEGTGAVVQVTSSGAIDHGFGGSGHASKFAANTRVETLTSKWSSSTSTLGCNSAMSDVSIDWSKADGLTLGTLVTQSMTSTISRQSANGTVISRTTQFQLSGERTTTWATDAASATPATIALKKTVTGLLSESLTTARKDGSQITLETQIQIQAGAPLVVSILRDKATQAWQAKTIVSGTMVTSEGEESRLEATYTNLKFSVASGCVPDSGAIAGTFFKGTEATPYRQYTITFDQGVGTITFADGATSDYIPQYCDLDDPAGTP